MILNAATVAEVVVGGTATVAHRRGFRGGRGGVVVGGGGGWGVSDAGAGARGGCGPKGSIRELLQDRARRSKSVIVHEATPQIRLGWPLGLPWR
eukprot:4654159-Alexandrium_andersonii.AAC.1